MTDSVDAIQRPGGGFRRMIKQVAGQPYPTIVLVGSLLLSAASFFTTFDGMLNFMRVVPVAFCIVFAIQGLLFVTSWRIGFAIAERERWPVFTTLVFLICLATSAFFSWVSLFGYINDEATQERTRTARMHSAVESTTDQLIGKLAERRDGAIVAMLNAPEYAAWAQSVEAVGDAALAARGAIEEAQSAEAAALVAEISELEDKRARILSDQAAADGRAAAKERRLKQLEEQRPAQIERIGAARAEFEALRDQTIVKEGEMVAEETGGVSGGGTGRGPAYRRLEEERNVLAARRDAKERLFEQAQAELAALDQEIETLVAELAAAQTGGQSPELPVIDKRVAELQARLAAIGGGGGLATDVGGMRAALASFKAHHDLAKFDQARETCDRLIGALRSDPASASLVSGLSCDTSGVAEHLTTIRGILVGERSMAESCAPGGAQAQDLGSLNFEEAVAYGRACIALAGLPTSEVEPLREEIERLILEESPDASGFVRAVNGWLNGDKLAYLSAAIAVFIDMLVLFSGLIGALSTSGTLQQALSGVMTKGEIEDFVRALRPDVARFILDNQRARSELGSEKRRGGKRAFRYAAHLDLARVRGSDELKNRARAFLIARQSKELALAAEVSEGHVRADDDFWLSDVLMRGLRAYLETPENHWIDELPLAGALGPEERRRAARALRKAATPYRAETMELADWSFAALIDLEKIRPDLSDKADALLLDNAQQVMLGLYSEGLAKPATFSVRQDTKAREHAYLVKEGALELLDRAARLSQAELKEQQEAEEMARARRNAHAHALAQAEAARRPMPSAPVAPPAAAPVVASVSQPPAAPVMTGGAAPTVVQEEADGVMEVTPVDAKGEAVLPKVSAAETSMRKVERPAPAQADAAPAEQGDAEDFADKMLAQEAFGGLRRGRRRNAG